MSNTISLFQDLHFSERPKSSQLNPTDRRATKLYTGSTGVLQDSMVPMKGVEKKSVGSEGRKCYFSISGQNSKTKLKRTSEHGYCSESLEIAQNDPTH